MRGTIERRKKLYMGSKSSSALGRSVGTPSKRFPVIVVIVIVTTSSKRFPFIKNSLDRVPSHPSHLERRILSSSCYVGNICHQNQGAHKTLWLFLFNLQLSGVENLLLGANNNDAINKIVTRYRGGGGGGGADNSITQMAVMDVSTSCG